MSVSSILPLGSIPVPIPNRASGPGFNSLQKVQVACHSLSILHNNVPVCWPVVGLFNASDCLWCVLRLRKDPLDPMDGGSKVKLAVQRINRPKEAAEADKAKKEAAAKAQAAAASSRSGKKAGSWGGLP